MRPTDLTGTPPPLLPGKRIVLGVSGGIAAYKAADLASFLVQRGVDLRVVMTESATRFVGPMTFEAITRNPVHRGVFDGWEGEDAGHVTLAASANLVVVAPATANTIARMAYGLADDMLSATLLATGAPIVVAPAMEHHMWHHPATRANVDLLRSRGVTIVEPERGHLASGASGDGRLAHRDRIVTAIRARLAQGGPLANRKIVISAGGTHEAIDPVRFIGNRSSGQMGVALAEAAFDLGAEVVTVAGPTVTSLPSVGRVERIESAIELEAAVQREVEDADALVMSAAVADFRPDEVAKSKIKKGPGTDAPVISLIRNPDILASVNRHGLVKVGFAAETDDVLANAKAKLTSKQVDMIVANEAVATIGSDQSEAMLVLADGRVIELARMTKVELARIIVGQIIALVGGERKRA